MKRRIFIGAIVAFISIYSSNTAANVEGNAIGTDSLAYGTGSIANGNYSISLGVSSKNNGSNSISIGKNSEIDYTNTVDSIAIGTESKVSGYSRGGIAIGYKSISKNLASIAVGEQSKATGLQASAFGSGANASGYSSLAIGRYSQSKGEGSVALGELAIASKAHNIAIGSDAVASGDNSIAIGARTPVWGSGSIALGSGARIYGGKKNTIAIGTGAVATEDNIVSFAYLPREPNLWTPPNSSELLNRRIVGVDKAINDNEAVNLKQLKDEIQSRDLRIEKVELTTKENTKSITDMQGSIKKIDTLETSVRENTNSITDMQGSIKKIDTLETSVRENTKSITDMQGSIKKIDTLETSVRENTKDITDMQGSIEKNSRVIKNVASQIEVSDKNSKEELKKLSLDVNHLNDMYSNQFNSINYEFSKMNKEVNRVASSNAALSGLHPLGFDAQNPSQIMIGYGSYKGEKSLAIGMAYYINENILGTVGSAFSGGFQQPIFNAGLTWKFGKSTDKEKINYRYNDLMSIIEKQELRIEALEKQISSMNN